VRGWELPQDRRQWIGENDRFRPRLSSRMSQLGVDGSILTVTGFAGAMERECYASDLLDNHCSFHLAFFYR
jgi:hypothetical protein